MKTFYQKIHKNRCPQIVPWSHAASQDIAQDILKATENLSKSSNLSWSHATFPNFTQVILKTHSLTLKKNRYQCNNQQELHITNKISIKQDFLVTPGAVVAVF